MNTHGIFGFILKYNFWLVLPQDTYTFKRLTNGSQVRNFILLFFICCIFTKLSQAQQLIISIPNADITPKNEYVFTGESQLKLEKERGTENFLFGTYGVGYNTELALSAYNIKVPRSSVNASVAPGFKTSVQIFRERLDKLQLKLTGGQMIPLSFNGKEVGSWTYGHLSLRLPALDTRLTGGANFGTRQIFGRSQFSFLTGVEQPITEKLMFVADWVSGTHQFAALAVGLQSHINRDTAILVAYKLPNNTLSGERAIIFEIVKHFR